MVRFHLAPPVESLRRHAVLKKLLIVAGVLGVAAVVFRKVRSANEERALWHEATTAPDLR